MLWISFECNQHLKLAPLFERATVGSSTSNTYVLDGRTLLPLQGQFFKRDSDLFYRDFIARNVSRLREKIPFWIGDWKCQFDSLEHTFVLHQARIAEEFRSALKEQTYRSLAAALALVKRQLFLSEQIPNSIQEWLTSQFKEIALESPIELLLGDPEITDICVEAYDCIWVERQGEFQASGLRFASSRSYQIYLENLLGQLQKQIDEVRPFIDFVLPDGSRGHLVGSPVAPSGCLYLSIRKKRLNLFTLEQLLRVEMFNTQTQNLLERAIQEKRNILVSGATGSGKTTLAKALIWACPPKEHLIVLEDTAELATERRNTIYLVSRAEGQGELPAITLRHLVRQALRMRPDRLIVGEVRGEEALDLMHAMNTGHRGCFATLHANSCRDALFRLQGLIQMSSAALSEVVTRDLISRNIHLLLHCDRNGEGRRKVSEVAWVRGMDSQNVLLERVL